MARNGERPAIVRYAVTSTSLQAVTGTARHVDSAVIATSWAASTCTRSHLDQHRHSPYRKMSRIYGPARRLCACSIVVVARTRATVQETVPRRCTKAWSQPPISFGCRKALAISTLFRQKPIRFSGLGVSLNRKGIEQCHSII